MPGFALAIIWKILQERQHRQRYIKALTQYNSHPQYFLAMSEISKFNLWGGNIFVQEDVLGRQKNAVHGGCELKLSAS